MPQRKVRGLTRDRAVEAGLGLINEEGADAVTMRRLAELVDVTPMALYNHFSNKRDLLRAIAEHVVGQADFDGRHRDWRDQIRHCFRTLRRLCLDHPGLPHLLEIEGAAPASVSGPMDVAVAALRQAGLDEVDSLRTFFLLTGFTLSQAAYQSRGPLPGLEPALGGHDWDFDASFECGLELVIAGVEARASR